jgi:membrane protein implicated in regulation of membrane protease activity
MLEFAQQLAWWHWFIAAAVLAAAETFLPGAIAIWFAAAAVVVGSLLLIMPIPWQLQLVLFGALGVVAIVVWRRYRFGGENDSVQSTLNQRGQQYVGHEYTLVEALSGGNGKIRVGDTVWLVNGADAPAGSRVRVVGVNGAVLRVERAAQAT